MERIGKYIIHKQVLTHFYASIVFGHDPDLVVPVAIKVFDPRRVSDGPLSPAQLLARFVAEARIMASLDHPCIVSVKSMDKLEDGRPYFVMPYLPAHLVFEIGKDGGETAADKPRRMALPRAVTVLRQVASALALVHRAGMVHRAVKPSNILLSAREGGAARLADFSMVKMADRNLPMPDHWMGDTDYCAPEQRDNATGVGPQADVYSLGVLAYRLVTGSLPNLSQGCVRLPEDLSPALADLIRRATDSDPGNRPAHAAAVLPLLEAVPLNRNVVQPKVQVVPARKVLGPVE